MTHHRIRVRPESDTPMNDATWMMREGIAFSPTEPASIHVVVTGRQAPLMAADTLRCYARHAGAALGSQVRIVVDETQEVNAL